MTAPKASEVNIIQEYNKLVDEISFEGLRELPKKLGGLKKWAGFVGIKNPDDLDNLDLVGPVERVVGFLGVLVKRIRTSEKKIASLQEEIEELKSNA